MQRTPDASVSQWFVFGHLVLICVKTQIKENKIFNGFRGVSVGYFIRPGVGVGVGVGVEADQEPGVGVGVGVGNRYHDSASLLLRAMKCTERKGGQLISETSFIIKKKCLTSLVI